MVDTCKSGTSQNYLDTARESRPSREERVFRHCCRNRGANRRGSSGHACRETVRTVAGLDDQSNAFAVPRVNNECYGIGEMPASNRQGAVTNAVRSSHGDDIDSDGACVTGLQPYSEGENESSPVCCRFPLNAGWNRNVLVRQGSHPVAGCHGLKVVEEVTPYSPRRTNRQNEPAS